MGKTVLAGVLVLAMVGLCHAQIKLGRQTTIAFASVDEGTAVLTARDDYIRRLSPFDRMARVKTDQSVSEEAFLEFVAKNILPWTDAEKASITAKIEPFVPQLEALALPWPATIYLVKTTGNIEGGAAYTRGNAVAVPAGMLRGFRGIDSRLLCHELFHVLSRHNPALRDRLYKAIGFEECHEIEMPASLAPRRLTNPDAPMNEHYISVRVDGNPAMAVPILFSRTDKYSVQQSGSFFNYLQFKFLLVERQGNSPNLEPVCNGDVPRLVDAGELEGFWEQVGRNTQYIYHPEEILADNFALLVIPRTNIPSPEIIEKMREGLSAALPAEPASSSVSTNP